MTDDINPQAAKRARGATRKAAEPGGKKPVKARGSKAASEMVTASGNSSVTPEQRYRMVAEAAYHHAERRGFVGGDPLNDWLLAEQEVDKLLKG